MSKLSCEVFRNPQTKKSSEEFSWRKSAPKGEKQLGGRPNCFPGGVLEVGSYWFRCAEAKKVTLPPEIPSPSSKFSKILNRKGTYTTARRGARSSSSPAGRNAEETPADAAPAS